MASITLTAEEYDALVASRDEARAERESLRGEVRTLKAERDLLQEKLNAFLRKLFDAKSEVRGTEQKDLFFNEAEAAAPSGTPVAEEVTAEIEIPAHTRKKRGRRPLDPNLPRDIVRHELPESERICAHDGSTLVEIGVEISEQLDIIPQQVRVIQHQRVKYACPCCDESIKVTPAPARIIPKGLLTASALAWVVTSKYMDALPLYRQAALLGRFGGDLSRSTLAASIVKVGEAVQPVINLLRDHLLDADLVHADETTIQVLKEPGKKAQTKSYLWAQATGSGPPIRLFGYAPGRGGNHANTLYAGIRRGVALMSDGYEVYGGIAEANGLTHLGCWAHARRYFVEAEAAIPQAARTPDQPATQFIAAMGELYAVEAQAKDKAAAERQRLRAEHSRPVLQKIEAMLLKHLHAVVPGSLLGKALHYLSAQWPKLIRYAENGAWPIDNNLCENAIRPFVIGRRNWLFADTVAGAHASANLYSLVETCKANGIDPYAYLVKLFGTLPTAQSADDFEALLPWHLVTAD
ncbi:MAG: IS66 family transposase [Rhodocyclaceae bacterium]|jgi:transposase|nr:IS66 family transposase [Rhodocyclaceae bacterium]